MKTKVTFQAQEFASFILLLKPAIKTYKEKAIVTTLAIEVVQDLFIYHTLDSLYDRACIKLNSMMKSPVRKLHFKLTAAECYCMMKAEIPVFNNTYNDLIKQNVFDQCIKQIHLEQALIMARIPVQTSDFLTINK